MENGEKALVAETTLNLSVASQQATLSRNLLFTYRVIMEHDVLVNCSLCIEYCGTRHGAEIPK